MENEFNLPPYLCTVCARQLVRSATFRTRSLRAHLILLEINKKHDFITLESIQSIVGVHGPFDSSVLPNEIDQNNLDMEFLAKENIHNDDQDARYLFDSQLDLPKDSIKLEVNEFVNQGIDSEPNAHTSTDIIENTIKIENNLHILDQDILNEDPAEDDMLCLPMVHEDTVIGGIKVENVGVMDHHSVSKELSNQCDMHADVFSGKEDSQAPGGAATSLPDVQADEIMSCDICSYRTNSHIQFFSHLKAHAASKSFNCKMCDYRTISKQFLTRHIMVHSGEKPYRCDVCHKTFNRKDHLRTHLRKHSGLKPYLCKICNKAFTTKGILTQHMQVHSDEKPYSCDICNKAFVRKLNLETHLPTHSDDKPYSCDVCKKTFKLMRNLRSHVKMHSDAKPHLCNICGEAFNSKSDLKTHVRIHSGGKGHPCHVCNKTFKKNIYLKTHLRTHFGDGPPQCRNIKIKVE